MIGDVSGKGIPAALFMAEIKGIFQSLSKFQLSPTEIIEKANEAIANCFDKSHFVTLIYAVVDVSKKTFTYIRAGHCALMHYQHAQASCHYLQDEGIGLGIIRNADFKNYIKVYEIPFYPNDMIVLYTDGFIEAIDKHNLQQFDANTWLNSFIASDKQSAVGVKNQLLYAFNKKIKSQDRGDDLALLVIKFL